MTVGIAWHEKPFCSEGENGRETAMNDATELDSDDLEAWQLDVQLGAAMTECKYELAVPLAERLLEIRDAKLGPMHELSLTALEVLVAGWMQLGQWERAVALLDRRFGLAHPRHVPVLIGWAATLMIKGELDEAEERALRALSIARDMIGPADSLVATSHSILADLGRRRKAWDHALMHAVEAFRLRASNLLQEPALVYKDLMLVGDIFMHVGEYEEARKALRMAVEITAGALESDPLKMAQALFLYGRAAMAEKKPEEAIHPFKGALEFYDKVYGEADGRLCNPITELGKAYQEAEYFDEAEETFQRLLRLFQSCYPESKATQAVPLAYLGEVAQQRKDHTRATAYFEEAVALGVAEFGEDSLRLHAVLDKAAEAQLAAENFERAEELSRWQIRVMLPHLPGQDEPALLSPVRRLADIEIRRLKDNRANEEELKRLLEWVTRLMQVATERLQAETEAIKARKSRPSGVS